ncbi:MAG: flagellar biosynthesis protein FlhF [Planctomycetota bacterium]
MPDVRTYRAASMREALTKVREELGADAVILKTRQVPTKRKMFGLKRGDDEYEITAGLGIEPTRRPGRKRPSSATTAVSGNRLDTYDDPAGGPPVTPAPRGPAMTIAERKAADIVRELTTRDLPSPLTSPESLRDALATQNRAAALPRVVDPRPTPAVADPDPNDRLVARLDVLGRQIERLERTDDAAARVEIDESLRPAFDRLVAADVEPTLARDLAVETGGRSAGGDPFVGPLADVVANELSCAGELPVGSRGRPYVAAFVGPTGVGKTTTVAKLAARYAFDRRHKVGLVTVDTQRVGAIDQLRSYADVMRLPLEVVPDAASMPVALDRLSDRDLVLIDTAGRSPRDAAGLRQLAGILGVPEIDEVVLTLGLSSSLRSAAAAIERFRPLTPSSLVVTKLDEADGYGPLLSLARRSGLPLRYVTDGQEVPDDIDAADPKRLAGELLGPTATPAGVGS